MEPGLWLVNLANPKGLVFLLAVLPRYLAIGVTMTLVALLVMGGYSGLFATAAVLLSLLRRGAPA